MKTYYIDESGNTGDVKISNDNFNDQPVFTLAAVSFKNIDKVNEKILQLKKEYNIQMPELKSGKKFYNNYERFTYELVLWLNRSRTEYVIEIVDKRSYLVSRVVDFFIFPGHFIDESQEIMNIMRSEVSQIIYRIIPDSILIEIHEYTISPSNEKLEKMFHDIDLVLKENIKRPKIEDIRSCFELTVNEYNKSKQKAPGDLNLYKHYLQESDINKRGEPIAFLSHLPSFCSIYARINQINNKELSGIEIIHDNQDHFNELIIDYKKRMEELSKENIVISSENGDYELLERASLTFSDSKELIGIQVADLIAGFTMRFLKNLINNEKNNELQWKTFCLLQRQANKHPGLGTLINCPEHIRQDIFHYCNHGITITDKLLKLQEKHRNGYTGF